jgi:hypothetical protein
MGPTAEARQATFYARMRAVPGTNRMWMKFTLLDRSSQGTAQVQAPQLAVWRKSRSGVGSFGYAQTVTGLQAGGIYAAAVQFRWLDSRGHVIKSIRRKSAECRQSGALPNLVITRVAGRPGEAAGTELYSIDVTNRGAATARSIFVDLLVDGAGADAAQIDKLDPGETTTVRITGPACKRRLRVVVDRLNTIHETNEDDNVVRPRCPVLP